MSDKEKLDIACKQLSKAIKNHEAIVDWKKVWRDFAARGSIQSRKANFQLLR